MKAAVIYEKGGLPQYADVPEPVAGGDDLMVHLIGQASNYLTHNYFKELARCRIPGKTGDGILWVFHKYAKSGSLFLGVS